MSAPLTAEEESEFIRIIDGILATADLETVTRKKIRQGLEATLGKELTEQKHAVRSLIEARFDAMNSVDTQPMPTPPAASTTDASPKRESNSDTPSDDADTYPVVDDGQIEVSSLPPAKKKQKRDSSVEDADARLAAELQAQENRLARARTTRGGASAKPSKSKSKAAKKKSEKRVREDDSEGGGGVSDSAPKRKTGGGFQKPFNLSYPLAEICGVIQMSRPQVVKKLWEHIKANDLQDPKDKRQILCDDKMQAVFKTAKLDMFQMNKLLGHQLYPIDDEE
ncbi:upstream activation factor subunit spp27 [Phialemonium atrogriseum]|uniref:Upstream activation factor subunit spp27 n=1 Tax=Phialemonium atrogriseum TaxID=1093897 RepID=A0AAJ0C4W5_9PEZI|nr:upstream activation factor subunit spp27 [Phialemonium atrogriseum]KAK1770214.1 upstream activation factor subunit spp27 [Phialemonium atrogriseum]